MEIKKRASKVTNFDPFIMNCKAVCTKNSQIRNGNALD